MLRPVIRQTPLLESSALSELVGGPVYLKCENLQRGGSFKVRGAYVRIARLSDAERARGVVAASAGNHAQGVALAAAALGARATVVMPAAAALPKVAATRSYGADVVLHGATVEDALAMARELAEETGSIFIHPFDHPDVIAGQGTVGLEIAEQCPEVRTIALPVGGGGLAAGVAVAVQRGPAGRAADRRAGRGRGTGARLDRRGPAGQRDAVGDDGRRDRGRPAGRADHRAAGRAADAHCSR